MFHHGNNLALPLPYFVRSFFTAFLNRDTSKTMNGVTATAIGVKSQFNQSMMTSIARM